MGLADGGVLANLTIRLCPGRYYADASLFINVAMVLHVFDISPPLDKDGKGMNINSQMTNGLLSCVMTVDLESGLAIALDHSYRACRSPGIRKTVVAR